MSLRVICRGPESYSWDLRYLKYHWTQLPPSGGISSITRRRKWQPTPVLLPGKSHGWRSLVGYSPGVTKSRTRLHFHFSLSCIGEGNGNHSSVLAWRIPGREEPGGLLSLGSHRIRHDWNNLEAAAASVTVWSNMIATSHMWLLSTWNIANTNWDM